MPTLTPELPPLSRVETEALRRRRRGRNLAMLVVLVAVVVLFYAITVVKMARPDLTPH